MSAARILAACAALLLAAGVTWRRRRLGFEAKGLALLAVVALAVYASGLLSTIPDPERAIESVATTLGAWTYALVGTMAFLETGAFVGFIAPGEFTVILGGVIAGQGEIAIVPLVGLVWLCTMLGDTTSFFIGRRLGRAFLWNHGPRIKITHERLKQVEGYFDRHGGATVLIGRFIGLVRPIAPFIAGSSRMPYLRFLPYSVVGTGLWATGFCLLGFLFYRSFSEVTKIAGRATLGFGLLVAAIVLAVYTYRRLRHLEERRRLGRWFERQGERPLLRPLVAVAAPVWRRAVMPTWRLSAPRLRFLWQRLTPGGLGIEFTTAIAMSGVGLYVFGAYATILSPDPIVLPEDARSLELASRLRVGSVIDIVKIATELGAIVTVGAVVLVAAVLLAWRRRMPELATLVIGLAGVFVAVQVAKAGIARPRPATALVGTSGDAFPSGHAAYSTAYAVIAVIATRVLPGLVSRAAVVLSAIAIVAGVGLSRIYLHAHYWSDVAAGWGIGFGIFGACAAVALLVSHIRDTGAEPGEAGRGP